jgi:TP901 family phage tail tape measure protein
MIGAHELLLIVRGQNQASAALGRVARDIRGLQRQRDLRARQATLVNRAAAQALRVQQMESFLGSRQIALAQGRIRAEHQIEAVVDRTTGLELRRAGIVARSNQLLRQEERIKEQILGLDDKDFQARTRILGAEQRLARTQASIAGLQRGRVNAQGVMVQDPGIGRAQAALRASRAETSAMQAEIARDMARMRAEAAAGGEGGDPGGVAARRAQIAERRFAEAQEGARIAKQAVRELSVVEKDLQRTEQIQLRQVTELRNARAALANEEKALTAQLQAQKDAWALLGARERQVQATERQHARQITELQGRLKALGVQELELAEQSRIASAALKMQQAEIAALGEQIANQKWENFATGARAISHIGRVMQMTGLITVAGFAAMGVAAAKFSREATLAATQARRPGESFAATARISRRVQGEIIKMMQQFPASSEEMANSFYEIFSGTNVQNVQKATDMVRVFNQMAVAGGTDLKTMTDAGITLYNNFPREFKTMTDAGNAFFAAVRYGRMNAEQFATSLSSVVPIAKEAGLTFKDVADAMAILTRQSGARFTSRDATGLARMIQLLARPEMVQGLRNIGVEVRNQQGQMRPILEIIQEIVKHRPELRKGGIDALNFFKTISAAGGSGRGFQGTVQAARSFAFLAQNVGQYGKVARQVNQDHKELQQSFAALSRDPGVQWQVFTNQLRALILVIGQGAIPALVQMGAPVARLARYIEGLSPHTRRLIGYIGAISAVSLLVVGSMAVLVGSIASMVITFRAAYLWLVKTRAGVGGLGAEAGVARVGLLRLLGGFGLMIIALPILAKLTGSYTSAIKDMIIAYSLWKAAAVVGMANPLTAVLIGAVVATKMLSDRFTKSQKEMLEAQSRVANNRDVNRMGTTFAKQIANMQVEGKSTVEIFKLMRDRLGDSDNAAVILGNAFRKAGAEARKMAHEQYLSERMMPKVGRPDPNARPGGMLQLPDTTPGPMSTVQYRRRLQQLNRLRMAAEQQPNAVKWQRYYTLLEALNKQATSTQQSTVEQIGTLTDRQVMGMARRVAVLQAAWERSPSLENWNRFYAAQEGLSEQATARQQQMVQQVGLLTDQQVIRMTVRAAQMRAAFEKAPTTANWRAWKAAMDSITSQATQDQQQMAGDVQKISDSQVMTQVTNLNKLARIANKSRSFADIKAYNVGLQQLQDVATSTQMSTAQNFLVGLDTTMKKATSKIKKNAEDAKQALDQIAGTLSSTFDQMQQQNQTAFGTLFQGPVVQGARMQFREQYGYKPKGKDYLQDLRAMLSRFRQWQRVLQQLRRRGAPFELVQQIQAMGPDALPEARALLGMQRPEFQQYVRVFRTSQRVIAQASSRDMNRQLVHWRSLGSNIMKAVLQGMDEHAAQFSNYFRNLAIKLFPQLAKSARATPRAATDPVVVAGQPRRPGHPLPRGRVPRAPARRVPRGVRVGGRTLQSAAPPNVTVRTAPARPSRVTTNNYYNNYQYTYEAGGHGMDYSTWLRKSRSHMRNRR